MLRRRAFTLVEIVVTLFIIIILTSAGSMAYKSHQDRTNLDYQYQTFKEKIERTKNLALSNFTSNNKYQTLVINLTKSDQIYNPGDPNTPSCTAGQDTPPYCYQIKANYWRMFNSVEVTSEAANATPDSYQPYLPQLTLSYNYPNVLSL